MAGSSKGITVVAKLLGGKQIAVESKEINKSLESTGGAVKTADEEASKAGGGYQLFAAKQKKALSDAEKNHKSFLKTANGAASSLLGGGKGFMGAGALGYGLYDSLKQGSEYAAKQATLRQALQNAHQLHGNVMNRIDQSMTQSAISGGFARNEQIQGITSLISETGSAAMAMRLNASATNLARGAHIEYGQALKMVQQGMTGTAGKFQKYLGIIIPVKTHMEELTKANKHATAAEKEQATILDKQATSRRVMAAVESKYAGQQAAYSKSTPGQFSNLKHTIQTLAEKIGTALLPALTSAGKLLMGGVQWLMKHKTATKILVGAIGFLVLALVALKVATTIQSAASGIAAVKLLIFGTAATTATPATTGLAGAVGALDLSMGLMVIAFVAAGVAVYEIITHFKLFEKVISGVFAWIKDHWKLLAEIILTPLLGPIVLIAAHWNAFIGFFKQIPGKLAAAGKGMWGFIKTEFKSAIDWILRGWNKLHFKMPGVHTPFGMIGGFNIGLPQIPLLAEGGTVARPGLSIVGDRGPELLSLPMGARVDPLLPGSRPQGAPGTWHGSDGNLTVICQIDRKEVARAVINEVGREFARGNR
jgi:hypothetical protein